MQAPRQEDVKFVLPRFVYEPKADTHPFELRSSTCFLKVLAIFSPAQVVAYGTVSMRLCLCLNVCAMCVCVCACVVCLDVSVCVCAWMSLSVCLSLYLCMCQFLDVYA